MKVLFKCFALLGLAICSTFAFDATTEDDGGQVIPLRTHSIYMPYIDQDLQSRWFDFGADAVINTNKHIRLTHDRQSQTGWLWSRLYEASTLSELFRYET
ncbi:hypothetical protein RclHR1_06190012 [Rhizophagus clarus]|uniref:L-type lectin-like domain-containing protein n=1 Tax=Rhizophagus clarus TaxID=94130 RepID=A0A2Z6RWV5_9GLOM|nr:hypothetical protein RclHR1_06190012 [Rhizophagus clarus]